MARHTKRRASVKHHARRRNEPNPRRRRRNVSVRHRRRHNPAGLGRPVDWVIGGAGVLGGVVVTRGLPQVVLQAKNTGAVGYFSNAVAAAGAGWLAHLLFKKPVLTASVIAGGFAALIARIISDQTSYGKFLSLTGLGDYNMNFRFAIPQRLGRDLRSVEIPAGWGAPAVAAPGGGLAGGMDSASMC